MLERTMVIGDSVGYVSDHLLFHFTSLNKGHIRYVCWRLYVTSLFTSASDVTLFSYLALFSF